MTDTGEDGVVCEPDGSSPRSIDAQETDSERSLLELVLRFGTYVFLGER